IESVAAKADSKQTLAKQDSGQTLGPQSPVLEPGLTDSVDVRAERAENELTPRQDNISADEGPSRDATEDTKEQLPTLATESVVYSSDPETVAALRQASLNADSLGAEQLQLIRDVDASIARVAELDVQSCKIPLLARANWLPTYWRDEIEAMPASDAGEK